MATYRPTITCVYKICNLHIIHKALYLPPKILHNLCFSILVGITAIPREIENNACAKFGGWWGGGGANKAHYGKCASGVWAILWLTFWVASSTMNTRSLLSNSIKILLLELKSVLEFQKIKKRMFFQKKRAHRTFCLCLRVVKDWVRKITLPTSHFGVLRRGSIWLLKEFVPSLFLHRNISNCMLTKMWRIKQLLIHHLHWRGLTQCLGLLSR